MDSTQTALATTNNMDVEFDIEAIEHYDAVHTVANFPRPTIITADGRIANAWLFFAYQNDTGGHVGSSGGSICNGWSGAYQAYDFDGGNSDTNLINVRLISFVVQSDFINNYVLHP